MCLIQPCSDPVCSLVPDFGILNSLESVFPSLSAHDLVFCFFGKKQSNKSEESSPQKEKYYTLPFPAPHSCPVHNHTWPFFFSTISEVAPPTPSPGPPTSPLCPKSCSFSPAVLSFASQGTLSSV